VAIPGGVTPDTSGMGGQVSPELLIPKRNPRLIDRIAGLIFRAQPQTGPQPAQQQSTVSGITVQALQSVFDQYFKSQSDRLAVYKDVDEMDEVSEEISVALDTIADNATTSEDGMQMTFQAASEDQKIADVLDQVVNDARLHRIVYSLARNLIKYGDNFAEIVVNAEGQITELRQLPPSTMFRNQDARGDLKLGKPEYDQDSGACTSPGGTCAFEQRAEDTQAMVAAFWPWQVVHIRNNHDGFRPYGRSHLRVARIIWKKLKAIEEAMIIARLTRAYPKLFVKVDTTGLSPAEAKVAIGEVNQAMNQRQAIDGRREQPYWILSDVYMGVPKVKDSEGKFTENASTVSLLEPSGSTVFNIDDIKTYFHRKLLCCLRIPPAHLGWEEQVNAKATVSQQDVQYVRFLRRIQQQIGQALEQVFDTALVLQGIDPTQAEYEITWPMLSATDEAAAADAEFSRAQADNLYAELHAIDAEWIMRHRFDMTDEEIEEIQKRMEEANQAAAAAAGQPGDDESAPAAEPTEEDDEEGPPETDDNQGREQEHEVTAEGEILQGWGPAARAAALAARRRKGAAKSAARAKAKVTVKPKPKVHGPVAGAHAHAHAHGTLVHSHPHAHAGGNTHVHPHAASHATHLSARAAGMPRDVHPQTHVRRNLVIAEDDPYDDYVQPRGAVDRSSVLMLSEAIKSRTLAILERDVDRVLDEQREALAKAREINEDVA